MSEFIIREEGFKLGWAEKVPSPQEGECFLLCQSGAGEQSSMLISYGIKYSSANRYAVSIPRLPWVPPPASSA